VGGTELAREAPLELFIKMGYCDAEGNLLPEVAARLKTIPQGAATTIWCATSPQLNGMGGLYCEHGDVASLTQETNILGGVKEYSLDEANAKRLWNLSEEMTGITFDID
jgi:hypothetical protein